MKSTILIIFMLIGVLFGLEARAEVYKFSDSRYLLEDAYQRLAFSQAVEEDKRDFQQWQGNLTLLEKESEEELRYQFLFYYPKDLTHSNLIVLTPNIEGVTILETEMAKYLVNKGFPVVVPIERAQNIVFDQGTAFRMERHIRRAMAGTFHIIEALKSRFPLINTQSMGVAGSSLGGIRSSILYGLDERFKAAFISVAGADIPLLYEVTQLESLVSFRDKHMEYLGLRDVSDYSAYLRKFLFLEPNIIINNPHLENVAMIISDNDEVVPTVNQWRLFSRIKEQGVHPKTYITKRGHLLAALELLFRRNRVLEWFQDKL